MITVSRIRIDPVTQAYVARCRAEGTTKMETMRCLKRYIARETYYLLKARDQQINRA
jgi:transposase